MILDDDCGKAAVFEPDGAGFYTTSRAPLGEVARQRKVTGTGFFDYTNFRATECFITAYGDLFRPSLGNPPTKHDVVYKNMKNP